jgi:predicted acyl esterase
LNLVDVRTTKGAYAAIDAPVLEELTMNRATARTRILVAFLLAFFLVAGFRASEAREAEYEVAVEKDVMAPMRDGVRLATDIYLPAKDGKAIEGKLPTILERRPYNKDGCGGSGRYFAARGYAFVGQDTRGRYKSEGVWHMLTDDGPDGVDTAAWIARQGWSNGKIGMIGTSYVGGTQHAMAMEKPPELVTTAAWFSTERGGEWTAMATRPALVAGIAVDRSLRGGVVRKTGCGKK